MSFQKPSRILCSLFLIATLVAFAFADTIRFEIGEGVRRKELTFSVAEIESITFDAPAPKIVNPSNTPASYPKPEGPVETASSPPVTKKAETPTKSSVTGSKAQPIKWNTKVAADNRSNGWTNCGWVVKKGQRIRIAGDGTISLGKGRSSTPSGLADVDDPQRLLKSIPTGALIAVIGNDNNEFIYIGAEREFTAARDGALFLGVNEGDLSDNSGIFDVTIEILPG